MSDYPKARRRLKRLTVKQVDIVGAPANPDANVVLFKAADQITLPTGETVDTTVLTITPNDAATITAGKSSAASVPADTHGADMPDEPTATDTVAKAAYDEAVEKAAAVQAQLDQVAKELQDIRDAEADRVMKATAAGYDTVAAPDDIANVLKAASAAGSDVWDATVRVLDAAKARIAGGGDLFVEKGTNTNGTSGDPVAELDAVAQRIAADNPDMSPVVAKAKALEQRPDLYAAYKQINAGTAR